MSNDKELSQEDTALLEKFALLVTATPTRALTMMKRMIAMELSDRALGVTSGPLPPPPPIKRLDSKLN